MLCAIFLGLQIFPDYVEKLIKIFALHDSDSVELQQHIWHENDRNT